MTILIYGGINMIHPIEFYNIRYSFFNPKGHSVLKAYESREDMENRLREERSSLESSINANNSEQNSCSGKISLLESRINEDKSDINSDNSKLSSNRQEYESKKSRLQDELHSDERQLQDDKSKLDKARTELSELKRKHDELESKLNRVM